MRHINKIVIKQATESRASSSCGSDIDRRELISSYGNEKYLSKWAVEGRDANASPGVQATDEQQPPRENKASEEQGCLPIDDDNESLVSYNSVRDGTPAKNAFLPYQVQQQSQDITLWQGYSGNIYFDSVRCRAINISSSKPNQKKTKDKSSLHRLTKSCSPSIEVRMSNSKHFISYSASSFQSLGSLRIGSRQDKKALSLKNQFQSSNKLYKGFVEIEDNGNMRRTYSSPASLVISGGQVNSKTDPIDRVYSLNTKVRSSSKGKLGSNLFDCQKFPDVNRENTSAKSNSKISDSHTDVKSHRDEQTKLPDVGRTVEKKDASEATPVFIIPFATWDDPVDAETTNTRKYEKRSSIEGEQETPKHLLEPVKLVQTPDKPVKQHLAVKPVAHKPVVRKPGKKDVENPDNHKPKKLETSTLGKNESNQCKRQENVSHQVPTHIINITGKSNVPQVLPRPDFHIYREISNSSLSNYLQTVPQKAAKNVLKEQKKRMPKLTYTQCTRELSMKEIENSYNEPLNGLKQTMALYGGYIPSTRGSPSFQGELPSEANSVNNTAISRKEKNLGAKSISKGAGVHNNGTEMNEKCHLPKVIGLNLS